MIDRKQLLAVFAVFAVVTNMTAPALAAATAPSSGLGMNPDADQYPETRIVEDQLTIESHDRSSMSWLQYENDNGKIETIDAHVNGTESGAKVSYRADQLELAEFGKYPRQGDEENNSVTWLNAGNWTSSGGVTVSDSAGSTASGVESVEIATDGSFTSGSSGHVAYGEQSITDDAEKRYLQLVMNVDRLESSAVLEVQVRDGGGDYVAATVDSSANASKANVIANQTASGVIFQEQLGQLEVQGSGDGSLDGVEEVRVVATDGDVTATVVGLNVQKKSQWDFGDEKVPDTSTDDSGDYTTERVIDRPQGGAIMLADLASLGSFASDAVVHKLTYYDVEYRMQDKPSAVSAEFRDADNRYPNFNVFDFTYRRTIPAAYDITHGNLTLETNQTFLSERYVQLRVAEGVGDTETSEISDSSWIDLTGSLGEAGTWLTADSTVSADKTYVIDAEIKVTDDQQSALEQAAGGGGFWGGGGGGNPFMSLYNWVAGGFVGLLTALGLKSKAGS
ncbi:MULTISPECIES: hypothetical protein [Halorussus]|uniref:hypothetical protein n=1 Tax=Halorussus TaxID=1070314 RepID=UPI0013B41DD4|nr:MULTISPECIES: hypothetical protein [Halorussus]NHN59818.1 hypothetical protein [Halorussus sp. JP-T4]